jgi:hypothetical protein
MVYASAALLVQREQNRESKRSCGTRSNGTRRNGKEKQEAMVDESASIEFETVAE